MYKINFTPNLHVQSVQHIKKGIIKRNTLITTTTRILMKSYQLLFIANKNNKDKFEVPNLKKNIA